MRYLIFDKERRRIVVDGIETHEQADAKLAELIEADTKAKGHLVVIGTLERDRSPNHSR